MVKQGKKNKMHSLVQVSVGTHADAIKVGEHIRPADRMEVAAALGKQVSPIVSMMLAVDYALQDRKAPCFSLRLNDVPVAMFGVYPHQSNSSVGYIWMLGTDGIEKSQIALHRELRDSLESLWNAGNYQELVACSYEENEVHHKWLTWLNFKLDTMITNEYGYVFKVFRLKRQQERFA